MVAFHPSAKMNDPKMLEMSSWAIRPTSVYWPRCCNAEISLKNVEYPDVSWQISKRILKEVVVNDVSYWNQQSLVILVSRLVKPSFRAFRPLAASEFATCR